uniref:Protein LMBR1L n=1 Tax=Romanomermis culicivorax TaxID=13658 RepID=A0A915JJS1_ROMCU
MDEDIELREKAFHGAVREYVICMLIFLGLYFFSYGILRALKKRNLYDDLYGCDEDDYVVYRISLWICTLSMAVSIAAVLLIPFSICSNEILLRYPNHYYIQWLNDSLIHSSINCSLWNYVFLLSNLCLFVLLPFSYFFIESQGFFGFKNGLMTRVYEALALCALVIVLGFCSARLVYILFNDEKSRSQSLLNIWYYQLPFIYSCVSLFGVALLLTCTPLGFATLFTVFGELIAKPKPTFTEYHRISAISKEVRKPSECYSTSPSVRRHGTEDSNGTGLLCFISPMINGEQYVAENLAQRIETVALRKKYLKQLSQSWLWLKNLKYPLVMVILLFFTGMAVLIVTLNTIELLVGFRSVPAVAEPKVELGQISLSTLGVCGTIFEAVLILYLMAASLVGFYSVPGLRRLKPAFQQTSMTKVIFNCVILIILASALPVLARTLGLTTFDLLGDYGKLDWLGNFYLVLSYNLIFAVATGLCLVTKFTSKLRKELVCRFNEASAQCLNTWTNTTQRQGSISANGNSSFCRSWSVDSKTDFYGYDSSKED